MNKGPGLSRAGKYSGRKVCLTRDTPVLCRNSGHILLTIPETGRFLDDHKMKFDVFCTRKASNGLSRPWNGPENSREEQGDLCWVLGFPIVLNDVSVFLAHSGLD
jgi:hypothetical protein